VQLDDKIPDNIRVPTETDMREVINYAVSKAIPALIMAVDERVGSILGKSVSTMKVTTNRVKVATQKRVHNPRRFTNKQSSPLDQDNGDTAAPTKSNGPKSTKINKQRVCFRHLVVSWKLLTTFVYFMPCQLRGQKCLNRSLKPAVLTGAFR
jgi:hypothetical protein